MMRTIILGFVFLLGVAISVLPAQTPAEDFQQNCAMCHTIGGGPLAGPDLAGMDERHERTWLVRFIVEPQAVIDSGDPAVKEMVSQYQGMVMPNPPGMTPERAAALIDYVAGLSGGPPPDGSASTVGLESGAPFTTEEVEIGRKLFRGERALQAGGSSCLSCHDVSGLTWLGGGALGPDLTNVYEHLGGRKGLTAWLSAPPTPTMSSLYRSRPLTEEEVRDLTAFLAESACRADERPSDRRAELLLLGLGGTAFLLLLFGRLWQERLRGVRRRLVHNSRLRGVQ